MDRGLMCEYAVIVSTNIVCSVASQDTLQGASKGPKQNIPWFPSIRVLPYGFYFPFMGN